MIFYLPNYFLTSSKGLPEYSPGGLFEDGFSSITDFVQLFFRFSFLFELLLLLFPWIHFWQRCKLIFFMYGFSSCLSPTYETNICFTIEAISGVPPNAVYAFCRIYWGFGKMTFLAFKTIEGRKAVLVA